MPSSSRARADRDHTYWTLIAGTCPTCGRRVDAKIVIREGRIYRQDVCPEHGVGEVLIDEDAGRYLRAARGSEGARDPETIAATRGVCPVCRELVPAEVIRSGGRILIRRECPEHGLATGLVSSDAAAYVDGLSCIKPGTVPFEFRTRVGEGCPKDCGLCPAHEQHTCLPIIEITERCDLDCPVCLVGSGRSRAAPKDLGPDEFKGILDGLIRAEGTLDLINLSGGEPTLHPAFRDIVALCDRPEILRTTVSTNGLRLARDEDLLDFLVDRNILISLQFDGFSRDIHPRLRGTDILAAKEKLLRLMEDRRAPLSLVVTARRHASETELGPILDYFFRHDHVVSLMIQPLSFTGSCRSSGVDPLDRLTTADIVRILAESSGGRLAVGDFSPLPCSHPACFSLTYLLKLADGGTVPLPRLIPVESYLDILKNRPLPGLEADSFEKIKDCLYQIWSSSGSAPDSKRVLTTVRRMFDEVCCPGQGLSPRQALAAGERWVKSIFIHHFMDEDNYDLARAVKCCNHYPLPDGRLMPACTYNVFYRPRRADVRASERAPSGKARRRR